MFYTYIIFACFVIISMPPVTGEFPSQRASNAAFDVFYVSSYSCSTNSQMIGDLRLNDVHVTLLYCEYSEIHQKTHQAWITDILDCYIYFVMFFVCFCVFLHHYLRLLYVSVMYLVIQYWYLSYLCVMLFIQKKIATGRPFHFGDVIMGTVESQITSLTVVYSTVYSDADQRKPVNSPHRWPVTREMFPFDDVIMWSKITDTKAITAVHVHQPQLTTQYPACLTVHLFQVTTHRCH